MSALRLLGRNGEEDDGGEDDGGEEDGEEDERDADGSEGEDSGMIDVVLPQLGETITEGTIIRWLKQVGETVEVDEPLYEISTDKVDSEVPSSAAGVLTKIVVDAGETVEVGAVLAVMSETGSPTSSEAVGSGSGGGAQEEGASGGDVAHSSPADGASDGVSERSSDGAPGGAGSKGAGSKKKPGDAEPGEAEPKVAEPRQASAADAPVGEADSGSAASSVTGSGGAPRLMSPVVRRLVNEHQLDISGFEGSGTGGRITREDVERLIRSASASDQEPSAPAQPASADSQTPADRKVMRLSRIRKSIGAHMVRSKATSPHVLTAMEVDFESVERVRQGARSSWRAREGFSLTYLPFIVRAVCEALSDFPHMNAAVDGDKLLLHEEVHLAVAVDLDFQGLLAPVIRNAETKRLRPIAREIVDLAARARRKELSADEVTGGTFTITNPGQYGTLMQFPIINQPQVAILSTDGISRKPVVVTAPDGTEAVAIHSVGVLALAWDHRAFDGAYAAAFLSRLRSVITTRDWEAELK